MISQSGRVCPGGSTALRTRCTRRSVLVKVPSFSAYSAAGRKTSAYLAVSVMKMFWTTRKSRLPSALRTWLASASVSAGSSPMMYIALSVPSTASSNISGMRSPIVSGIGTP